MSREFTVGALKMLGFTIKDAEYSKQLDRIVAVGNEPSALYIYDPWTGDAASVALPLAATSVGVGPDGTFAAIGHDGWVSYVDLVARELVVTHPVTADVLDVVLADNGFIYAFPAQDQWEQIYSVEIATGTQTESQGWSIYAGTVAKLHPSGDFMYGADNGLSPSDIEKYDIQGGTANYLYDSPYHGDYGMCGDLWMAEDGKRIFTRCGNVFFASTDKAKDMTYNGSFPDDIAYIEHLSHSTAAGKVALIPGEWWFPQETEVDDTAVHVFNYDFLTTAGVIPLPKVESKGLQHPMHGRFVFHDCLGENIFVIAQADPAASFLNDYGAIHL
jgi:chitinase